MYVSQFPVLLDGFGDAAADPLFLAERIMAAIASVALLRILCRMNTKSASDWRVAVFIRARS